MSCEQAFTALLLSGLSAARQLMALLYRDASVCGEGGVCLQKRTVLCLMRRGVT